MAPFYDDFTSEHRYDEWTSTLERLATAHGLSGTRLLDVGCGTGKSFLPFLGRGYDVVACDISPEMVALAQAKAPDVPLSIHDLRSLPRMGEFDLVTCLDDCLNHILDSADLERAFSGFARNLAPGGIAVFDVNTLGTYRGFFGSSFVQETAGRLAVWSGGTSGAAGSGALAHAAYSVFEHEGGVAWTRTRVEHVQRHHPEPLIRRALATAGLEAVGLYGHGTDGRPHPGVDELVDTKAVYLARHAH